MTEEYRGPPDSDIPYKDLPRWKKIRGCLVYVGFLYLAIFVFLIIITIMWRILTW